MDVNNDGHPDILSGSYSRQSQEMAGLFQVLWGQQNGTFKSAQTLKGVDGKPLIIPHSGPAEVTESICTRPSAVDWDNDGDLDLVAGNFNGRFYLFTGEGDGKFQPRPTRLRAAGKALQVAGHGDPFPVDWDGDGDLDLLSGAGDGSVHWAENIAVRGRLPQLKPFRPLVESKFQPEWGELLYESDFKGPVSSGRVWADDVNGDGKLDLLVGDQVTLVSPANGLSEAQFNQRFKPWKKEFEKAQESISNDAFETVYEKRTAFMTEEMTGYVWLYLQK